MSVAAIISLVKANSNLQNLSAAELASAINADSIEQRDDKRKNLVDVIGVLGLADATACADALSTAVSDASPLPSSTKTLLRTIQATIATTGINLAGDETRAVIDALASAGAMSSGLASRLKDLGRKQLSLADTIGGDVTEQDCQAAIDEIAAEAAKELLLQQATARWNSVISAIGDGTAKTEQQVISIFGA